MGLTNLARALRVRQTDAERRLWRALRSRQFEGYKFRRQKPVGPYVADFLCLHPKLIIEADGSQHLDSVTDAIRDEWFRREGYQVLRFSDRDILTETQAVLHAILLVLHEPAPGTRPSP